MLGLDDKDKNEDDEKFRRKNEVRHVITEKNITHFISKFQLHSKPTLIAEKRELVLLNQREEDIVPKSIATKGDRD